MDGVFGGYEIGVFIDVVFFVGLFVEVFFDKEVIFFVFKER